VQTSLPYNDIRCLAASGANLFVGTYGGGVFLSTDTGENWQPANGDLTDTLVLTLTMDGLHLFAGTHGEGIFFSTNNGTSWTAVNEGLANRHVTALAVARNGTDGTYLFAGVGSVGTASSGIYKSSNNGATWIRSRSANGGGPILVNPPYVYAVVLFGGEFGGDALFRSKDFGTSWLDLWGSGWPFCCASIKALTASPDGRHFFAAENSFDYVHHSTDGGLTWISNISPSNTVLSLVVHPFPAPSTRFDLFAGTVGRGIFRSSDNSATWTEVNDGFPPNVTVNALQTYGQYLFAATGQGVWRRRLSELVTSVQQSTGAPNRFTLEQNYPNPFNPATRIPFSVQGSGFTSLKVYDILGREVRTLVNEYLQPGSYEVTFDASGLASGVYLYRLQAGEFTQTKHMLLMR